MRLHHLLATTALLFAGASAANAASYTFDVLYSGGDVGVLAAGSDDPLATTLLAGDTFTYSLTATPGLAWRSIDSANIFPFFALAVAEADTRTLDYTFSLNNDGVSVFSDTASVSNTSVHLGTNTLFLQGGLTFDQYLLTGTITSANGGSTPVSLLSWPGQAPEFYAPNAITFGPDGSGAVPEPATWGLMLAGFGLVGCALRRRSGTMAAA